LNPLSSVQPAGIGGDGSGGSGNDEHQTGNRTKRRQHKTGRDHRAEPAGTGTEAEDAG